MKIKRFKMDEYEKKHMGYLYKEESNQIGYEFDTNEPNDLWYGFNYDDEHFRQHWEILEMDKYEEYMKKWRKLYENQ